MNNAQATFTIIVPWWAYAAFTVAVLGLIAAGYVIGRLDQRDARAEAAIDREFAPTLDRWRHLDRNQAAGERAAAWPVNRTEPRWALVLEAWGQPRPAAGCPRPPVLIAEPDPRHVGPTVGRAVVDGRPLDVWEQIEAMRAALGHVRWAADVEETGYIPAVRA